MTLSGDALALLRYNNLDLSGLDTSEKNEVWQAQKKKANIDINYLVGNAVVFPTGTPPMSNSSGPIVGQGILT